MGFSLSTSWLNAGFLEPSTAVSGIFTSRLMEFIEGAGRCLEGRWMFGTEKDGFCRDGFVRINGELGSMAYFTYVSTWGIPWGYNPLILTFY